MLPPAEKKGEVGYVEDWLPAPLVHQLAKGEGVDDCAHVGGGDHPRTADFLKRKEKDVELRRKGLHLSRATRVGRRESGCNSGDWC